MVRARVFGELSVDCGNTFGEAIETNQNNRALTHPVIYYAL